MSKDQFIYEALMSLTELVDMLKGQQEMHELLIRSLDDRLVGLQKQVLQMAELLEEMAR